MSVDSAGRIADAFRDDGLIEPLTETEVEDAAAARAVQAATLDALGGTIAGWKIGATTAKAQAIMQANGPFFGPILASRVWADGAHLPLPAGFRGFECEFALRVGADLPARDGGYDSKQLAIAIDAVVPAIELVATRQRLEGMGNATLAWADLGFNHGVVLGAPLMPPPLDALSEALVIASVDGEETGRGVGADVLGHPLEAVAWLTRQHVSLKAGQLVSTGTCTGIAALEPGAAALGDFGALGQVRFTAL